MFSFSEKKDYMVIKIIEPKIFQEKVFIFKEQLLSIIENHSNKIILDMSGVEVINSTGIGVLILINDKIKKQSGIMIICCLNNLLNELFERMRLNTIFSITDSLDNAERFVKQ
ncbi:hypothetical protein DRQ07_00115 [candidate division KSB1 bacterium]|nr:MAG: hypothetical protein DRQ07_00115 [candidate division KSB1 bacterium]